MRCINLNACVVFLLVSLYAFGSEPVPRGISTEAEVVDWYDGDTLVANLKVQVRIRLLDCWTPEVRGDEKELGLIAKKHVISICPNGSKIRVFIPTTGRLQDSITFGRVLARCWIKSDDGWVDISDRMVADGYATKDKPVPEKESVDD
jgi:endonuclease YncB( thermonuclease family)